MVSSADAKALWIGCFDSFERPLVVYRLGAAKMGNCYGEEGGTSSVYSCKIMQNLNERDCMQNLILNHMHKGKISDDEQNRSSSGSSSQRSLGSCSRAAFG